MELNNLDSGRRQGIRDSFTHWWLVIRSSLVGVWVGMIPGLGSSVADWFAYGHARATEKEQKRLSEGDPWRYCCRLGDERKRGWVLDTDPSVWDPGLINLGIGIWRSVDCWCEARGKRS